MMLARSATERHPLPKTTEKPIPTAVLMRLNSSDKAAPRVVYQIDSMQLPQLQSITSRTHRLQPVMASPGTRAADPYPDPLRLTTDYLLVARPRDLGDLAPISSRNRTSHTFSVYAWRRRTFISCLVSGRQVVSALCPTQCHTEDRPPLSPSRRTPQVSRHVRLSPYYGLAHCEACGYLGTGAWAVVGNAGKQERKIHAAVDTLP